MMRRSSGAAVLGNRKDFLRTKSLPAGSFYSCSARLFLCVVGLALAPTVLAKCPNSCNQRGLCTGPGDNAFCICEHGYQGDDCSIRMCPKGDDPLTVGQSNRALMLRTTAEAGSLDGAITVTFNGESASLDANANLTSERECMLAFQSMRNIDSVSCERGVINEVGGADYVISLLSFPTYPYENNLYGHFGNPPLDSFSCNISTYEREGVVDSGARYPSCELIDVVTDNVKEYTECSHHGTCVRETGRCECNFGFKGDACDDILDADDAEVILAEGPFFTGSALKLRANRGLSPEFDLLKAIAGAHDVMTLTGSGDLILHEGALLIKPPTPESPPENAVWRKELPPEVLVVSGGSFRVDGGGANILSTRIDATALQVSVKGPWNEAEQSSAAMARKDVHSGFSGVALAIDVEEAPSDKFTLLDLSTSGGSTSLAGMYEEGDDGSSENRGVLNSVFSVRGDGRVSMSGGGGVDVEEGNLDVSQGDAFVKGNATVGHNLAVGVGGVDVAGGGLRVLEGGFEAHVSSSLTRGGNDGDAAAVISASHEEFSGNVLHVDAVGPRAAESGAVLIHASAGGNDVFELKATGATSIKAGGLDVEAGGVHIGSGGLTVASGGLVVDGGIRLRSGTLTIDGSTVRPHPTADNNIDSAEAPRIGSSREEDGERFGEGFEVASGGIRTVSRDASTPALMASAEGVGFGGAVLSLSVPKSEASGSFRLLQATVAPGKNAKDETAFGSEGQQSQHEDEVFVVDGTGKITSTGGLETGVDGEIIAGGGIVSQGRTVLDKHRAVRNEADGGFTIDAGLGTFFEVLDNARTKQFDANVVRIKGEAVAGQLLVVRNNDVKPTSGDAIIPPGYTVLFVHDGDKWRDLRVLEAAVTELSGVTSFVAANDLDIGSVTLRARNFVSSGNEGGKVALYGGGGLLTSDKGFTWDSASGTLSVPRLRAPEVADGMDFKGKPARNVALVNATIDRIPFLKTARFMLESAIGGAADPIDFAAANRVGCGGGVALFDRKGELSRADGVFVRPGGFLDVKGVGPHTQAGDVDFQGHTVRNVSLAEVTSLTGLERLEVASLYLPTPSTRNASGQVNSDSTVGGAVMVKTTEGELRAAGEAFSVESGTGTFSVPRIGPHEVTGDVDILGNSIRNAVLESPDIRGTVRRLRTGELSVTTKSAVSRGYLAVFSSESEVLGDGGGKTTSVLGQAAGGGGLVFRDGAVHNMRLGGTTVLEGNLDLAGHRLLNYEMDTPDFNDIEELTVFGSLRLDAHASARGSLLSVGARGAIGPADTASLALAAASVTATGPMVSGEMFCRGPADIGGRLDVGGGATVGGELELGGGMDARGNRVTNAYLENVSFKGRIAGDVGVEGGVKVGALASQHLARGQVGGYGLDEEDAEGRLDGEGSSNRARIVAVGAKGDLKVARGVEFDELEGVFSAGKISGHEVTGPVTFDGQALLSPALNFSMGGGIDGLSSLSVGDGGLDIEGLLRTDSDVIVEGSVTVAGAVMGRGPYMDSSDERLKADVEDISATDASDIVRRLRGVTYVFKTHGNSQLSSKSYPEGRQYGFIAQELGSILPELVSEDGRGFKVVAYSRLAPILTSALASALHRLDKLESRQINHDATMVGPSSTTENTIDRHRPHSVSRGAARIHLVDEVDQKSRRAKERSVTRVVGAVGAVRFERQDEAEAHKYDNVTTASTDLNIGKEKLMAASTDVSPSANGARNRKADGEGDRSTLLASSTVADNTEGSEEVLNIHNVELIGFDVGQLAGGGASSARRNKYKDGCKQRRMHLASAEKENAVLKGRVDVLENKLFNLEEKVEDLLRSIEKRITLNQGCSC